MKKREKNNLKTSTQKSIIDAEAFMRFFEEATGARFVDAGVSEKKSKNNKLKK